MKTTARKREQQSEGDRNIIRKLENRVAKKNELMWAVDSSMNCALNGPAICPNSGSNRQTAPILFKIKLSMTLSCSVRLLFLDFLLSWVVRISIFVPHKHCTVYFHPFRAKLCPKADETDAEGSLFFQFIMHLRLDNNR